MAAAARLAAQAAPLPLGPRLLPLGPRLLPFELPRRPLAPRRGARLGAASRGAAPAVAGRRRRPSTAPIWAPTMLATASTAETANGRFTRSVVPARAAPTVIGGT